MDEISKFQHFSPLFFRALPDGVKKNRGFGGGGGGGGGGPTLIRVRPKYDGFVFITFGVNRDTYL